ncbi:MAG: hypothetical protein ABIG92_01585 [Candidatus Omnitrophota bacterium]
MIIARRERTNYHFLNLVLVLLAIFSIRGVLSPANLLGVSLGMILAFSISWYMKGKYIKYMDLFIGVVSLSVCFFVFSRLYDVRMDFEGILRSFSLIFSYIAIIQAVSIRSSKHYSLLQFISIMLIFISIALAAEKEIFYILLSSVFLFIFIITMRFNVLYEKIERGALLVPKESNRRVFYREFKISSVMFFIIIMAASFLYPLVPRDKDLPLDFIASSFLRDSKIPMYASLVEGKGTFKKMGPGKEKEEGAIGGLDIESLKDALKSGIEEPVVSSRTSGAADSGRANTPPVSSISASSDSSLAMEVEKGVAQRKKINWWLLLLLMALIPILIPVPLAFMLPIVFIILPILIVVYFIIRSLIRNRLLARKAVEEPRYFIKEVYLALCSALSIYGAPEFRETGYIGFYDAVKKTVPGPYDPMKGLTDCALEAGFSDHDISPEHSKKALRFFIDVKKETLSLRKERLFWKNLAFRLQLLDITTLPKDLQ